MDFVINTGAKTNVEGEGEREREHEMGDVMYIIQDNIRLNTDG